MWIPMVCTRRALSRARGSISRISHHRLGLNLTEMFFASIDLSLLSQHRPVPHSADQIGPLPGVASCCPAPLGPGIEARRTARRTPRRTARRTALGSRSMMTLKSRPSKTVASPFWLGELTEAQNVGVVPVFEMEKDKRRT